MRNYEPGSLGQSMFDVLFETSPGRVDPRTGRLVESTAVPIPERTGFLDFLEVEPGRVDPRTGRLVPTTRRPGRELVPAEGREFERPRSSRREFGERYSYPRMREGYSESSGLSGPGPATNVFKNPLTWMIIGFGAMFALEALGVIDLSPQA